MEAILPNQRPKLVARARVQKDAVTGNPVLLYPEGVLMLNPTGNAVVSLCNGERTMAQIVGELAARYSTTAQQISTEVSDYVDRLRARNLVEVVGAEGD